jgi:hypothetical protein
MRLSIRLVGCMFSCSSMHSRDKTRILLLYVETAALSAFRSRQTQLLHRPSSLFIETNSDSSVVAFDHSLPTFEETSSNYRPDHQYTISLYRCLVSRLYHIHMWRHRHPSTASRRWLIQVWRHWHPLTASHRYRITFGVVAIHQRCHVVVVTMCGAIAVVIILS